MAERNDTAVAAAAVAFALCAVAGGARMLETGAPVRPVAAGGGTPFCAGVAIGAGEPGVVCARSRGSFLAEAVRAGLAPEACARTSLPPPARAGSLLVVREQEGACSAPEVRELPAATALLCGARVDVNRMSGKELELLPGVGPARARAIVESRGRDGPFRDVDDLDRVPGIGSRTVERLREWVVAGGGP